MSDWQRLSPRMLLVHPVHEVLRQLPVLVGSIVLGSATGNSAWPLAALGVTIGFGLLRWFFTTYRIDDEYVALRTGVLRRRSISVPRNRIRSVQTDSRLLHRLLGLTVLRVGTGHQARGQAAFALDAVEAAQVPRLRATLLAESVSVAEQPGGRGAGALASLVVAVRAAELFGPADDRRRGRLGLSVRSGVDDRPAGSESRHRGGASDGCGRRGQRGCGRRRWWSRCCLRCCGRWSTYGNLVLRRDRRGARPSEGVPSEGVTR